eukprot:jgi/Galph1/867/GphlegSOOS_G5608.1
MREKTVCYIAIMEYLTHTIASSHSHVGSVFRGGLVMSVAGLIGSVLALISLAMADGSGIALYFIMLVCCFIIAIIRLNPHLTPMGILANFMYGAALIFAVKTTPSRAWFVVYPTLLSAVWAGLAAAVSSIVLFPKLARTQLKDNVAQNLQRTGETLQNISSYLLGDREGQTETFTAVEDCHAIHMSLLYTRTLELWQTIINDVDQLVLYVEAIAGILRRERSFSKDSLLVFAGESASTLKEYFDCLCKDMYSLADTVRKQNEPFMTDEIADDYRQKMNSEIAKVFQRFWVSSYSLHTEQLPSSLESVSVIFLSFSLRTLNDGISKISEDLIEMYNEKQKRSSIWKNWFSWLEILVEPLEVYRRVPQLLRDKDNLKFLFRQVLSIAIIIVPSILVAGVSEADYHFTQNYNAVSAYIMVIIIYMRGIELTWYRLILYCITTVISSALAYAATMFASDDPYILTLWMGSWIYAALVPTLYFPAYIIADLGFVFGLFFTISCQYGSNFTFVYPASRVVSVFAGCFVVGVVSATCWPYKAFEDCRKTLSTVLEKEVELFCSLIEHFQQMNQQSSSEGGALMEQVKDQFSFIGGQLTKVRTMTNLDPSIGLTHPSIPKVLNAASAIFRRLICLRVILNTKPELTGIYRTTVWENYLCHMVQEYQMLETTCSELFHAIINRFQTKSSQRGDTSEIGRCHENFFYAHQNLFGEFRKLRMRLISNMNRLHHAVPSNNLSTGPSKNESIWKDEHFPLHSDDAIRHLAFLYCLFQVLDATDNLFLAVISLKPAKEVHEIKRSISQSIRNSKEISNDRFRELNDDFQTSYDPDHSSLPEQRSHSLRQESSIYDSTHEEQKVTLEMGYYRV